MDYEYYINEAVSKLEFQKRLYNVDYDDKLIIAVAKNLYEEDEYMKYTFDLEGAAV